MLTQESLKLICSYNSETGEFKKINKRKGPKAVNSKNSPYYRMAINGKFYTVHRLIWFYVYGKWPKDQIDHINGIGTDNRLCNLREVTHRQNQLNKKMHLNGKLPGSGTFLKKSKKWVSTFSLNGKKHLIGKFDTAREAQKAYYAKMKTLGLL